MCVVFDLLAHLKAEVVEVRTSEELHCVTLWSYLEGVDLHGAYLHDKRFVEALAGILHEKPVWDPAGMIFLAKSIQAGRRGAPLETWT